MSVSITAGPLQDTERRIMSTATIIPDLSARRSVESTQSLLAAIVESSDDAIIWMKVDGEILNWNKAAQLAYGYETQEVVGRNISLLVPPDRLRELHGIQERIARGERVTHLETVRLAKGGTRVEVSLTISPVRDGAEKVVGCFSIARYGRERNLALVAELNRAKEAAEAANMAKSEFLAHLSHEIRTPMNGIIGMTGIALQTDLSTDQREYLTAVRSSADALLAIINDALDFSRIGANALLIEPRKFNLQDEVGGAIKALSTAADQKGLELSCFVAPQIPATVIADPARLTQVMINLVGSWRRVDCSSAFLMASRTRSRLSGFSRKSKAPARVASTASAMVPCPEIMMAGAAPFWRTVLSRSMPLPSGSFISKR